MEPHLERTQLVERRGPLGDLSRRHVLDETTSFHLVAGKSLDGVEVVRQAEHLTATNYEVQMQRKWLERVWTGRRGLESLERQSQGERQQIACLEV